MDQLVWLKWILRACWLLFPSDRSLAGRPLWIFPERLSVHMAVHALGPTEYVHNVKEKRPGKNCGHWSHDCTLQLDLFPGSLLKSVSELSPRPSPSRVLGTAPVVPQEGSMPLPCTVTLCSQRAVCPQPCPHTSCHLRSMQQGPPNSAIALYLG